MLNPVCPQRVRQSVIVCDRNHLDAEGASVNISVMASSSPREEEFYAGALLEV